MQMSELELAALKVVVAEAESPSTTCNTYDDHVHYNTSLAIVKRLIDRERYRLHGDGPDGAP